MSVDSHFGKYEAQTALKHKILRQYLVPWAQILGRRHKRVVFVDSFAGGGSYGEDEKAGSPLIALSIARELKKTGIDLYCLFIEEDAKTADTLRSCLESRGFKSGDGYQIANRSFDKVVEAMRERRKKPYPCLFFVDPCGWTGYPMKSIRSVLKWEKTEVIINFMYDQLNRFIASPKGRIEWWTKLLDCTPEYYHDLRQELDRLRGRRREREDRIRDEYWDALKAKANSKYVLPVAAQYGDKNRTYFYLYHCSNHYLGTKIMKDVMHTATGGTYGYLTPEDLGEGQLLLSLDDAPTVRQRLEDLIFDRYRGATKSFQEITQETYDLTVLREKDYRSILKDAKKSGRVTFEQVSTIRGLDEHDRVVFPRVTAKQMELF